MLNVGVTAVAAECCKEHVGSPVAVVVAGTSGD